MRPYTYKALTSTDPLDVISLNQIKNYLKIELTETSEDDFLTLLISGAVDFVQKYTKRQLLTTQFLTYRDYWSYQEELRKSRFVELDSVKYYTDDVLTTFDTDNFYSTDENDFSKIILKDNKTFPDLDNRVQAIQITFKAGYGTTSSSIPDDILIALRSHIAFMYSNRGDCIEILSKISTAIPPTARMIYEKYRIIDIIL
ncbi:MAG: phage head-tail connector protein [Thermoplasmatales archaeon]|nr:MAG: phage head-tail connector protein [Thermoplasmatales archaeon]